VIPSLVVTHEKTQHTAAGFEPTDVTFWISLNLELIVFLLLYLTIPKLS
jgi:hypothetical protein